MSDLAPKTFKSDTFGQRKKGRSFFSIPGILLGCNSKGVHESARSPATPLDLEASSNPSYLSSSGSSNSSSQKKWDCGWNCGKVGLAIAMSLVDETNPSCEVLGSLKSKNIVLRPLVKVNIYPNSSSNSNVSVASTLNASSLPGINMYLPHSSASDSSNLVFRAKEVPIEPELLGEIAQDPIVNLPSPTSKTIGPGSSSMKFYSGNRVKAINPPLANGNRSRFDYNPWRNWPASPPKPLGSLAASEILLSEEYTCIIFYGPKPKVTHIYGDRTLRGHPYYLRNFVNKAKQVTNLLQVAGHLQGSAKCEYPLAEFLKFCQKCGKKIKEEKDVYMYRGNRPFCSEQCRCDVILADGEMEETVNNSSESSSESSSQEVVFSLGPMDSTEAACKCLHQGSNVSFE